MMWEKLGKVFDPREHELPDGCKEYAQSPQALIFDHFVRIYFATRQQDPGGAKSRSHIAFVDMDRSFKKVLRVSANTVIELGRLGCFDEHGIFPMSVLKHGDMVYAYTCGWNRKVSVSVDTSIGFAVSSDGGLTFNKLGEGPVLTSSLHEPFLVGDPFVKEFEDWFHMWYIYGTQWKQPVASVSPERTYKIGHATSRDGIYWQRDGRQVVEDKLPDESQALPTVIGFQGKYHMFFCYRHSADFRRNRERSYRIGYAYSVDLVSWTRDDANVGIDVTKGDWDSDMLCYPNVFDCDGIIYMLYNGNEFGRYGFGLARLRASS